MQSFSKVGQPGKTSRLCAGVGLLLNPEIPYGEIDMGFADIVSVSQTHGRITGAVSCNPSSNSQRLTLWLLLQDLGKESRRLDRPHDPLRELKPLCPWTLEVLDHLHIEGSNLNK